MMRFRSVVAIGVLTLSLGAFVISAEGGPLARIKERGAISICANPEALPFSSSNPGQPGIQIELAEALAKILGVHTRYEWIYYRPQARLVDCDAFMGMIVTEETESKGPFLLTKPYYGSGYILVLPKGTNGVKSFFELKGKKIGVEYSSWVHYVLDTKGFAIKTYANQDEILEGLEKGEVDAGAVVLANVGWYLKQHPNSSIRIAEGYIPEPDLRWNVAIQLRNADHPLEEAVNQALDQLLKDGTVQSLFVKYGIPYYQPFPLK